MGSDSLSTDGRALDEHLAGQGRPGNADESPDSGPVAMRPHHLGSAIRRFCRGTWSAISVFGCLGVASRQPPRLPRSVKPLSTCPGLFGRIGVRDRIFYLHLCTEPLTRGVERVIRATSRGVTRGCAKRRLSATLPPLKAAPTERH